MTEQAAVWDEPSLEAHAQEVTDRRPPLPLVLDLDGCLLRTDLLWESALRYVAAAPWRLVTLAVWLMRFGRAGLKARLAQAGRLDVASLPVDDRVAAFAVAAQEQGREIHVATAADALLAGATVAARFPFAKSVFSSDGVSNLKGPAKARLLQDRFPAGFAYAGDSSSDLNVWRVASEIVVVNATSSTLRAAREIAEPHLVLPRPSRLRAAWKALRPHQWAKNALLFVPVVLSGHLTEAHALATVLLAFVALSTVASATYILNDLWDLDDDRRHWTKRNRPLASGTLPIPHGVALAAGGLALGGGLAALGGWSVLLCTILYVVATLTYSFKLKRQPLLDVMALAGLFTLRLATGAIAANVIVSPWLLTFSAFLFLSLSLAKRHIELARSAAAGRTGAAGRGYRVEDASLVQSLGIGSLLASIVVFVLYLTQEAFTTAHLVSPKVLWAFPPALFLLGARLWLCSSRGELDDDPVSFALKDRYSLKVVAGMALVFTLAWVGVPTL